MSNPINVTVMATMGSNQIGLDSDELELDSTGFYYELAKGSTQSVVIRLKGTTEAHHAAITGVRSVPTPDSGNGPWTSWTNTNDAFASPPFPLGTEIRIEVANSAGADPIPRGGGHFRIVEEGGGGTL